jgi:hypothetical protein
MSAARTTRKPTGKPAWPVVLLTGVQGSGKTYKAAEATGSDLVGRALWVGIGENDPDEYGRVPGADFEIVNHDGTYRDTLAALRWASSQPRVDGKPTLLVVDSFGREWELLSDMAQAEANKRRRDPSGEARIASDLWNLAGARWAKLLKVLTDHDGPVIVTARLDRQTVFSEAGDPTKEKTYKVKAQKGLAFDVDVVVEFREPFPAGVHVTKARSLTFAADPDREVTDFSVDKLLRALGLGEPDAAGTRQTAQLVLDAAGDEDGATAADAVRAALLELCAARGWHPGAIAARYRTAHGEALQTDDDVDRIREFVEVLKTESDAPA